MEFLHVAKKYYCFLFLEAAGGCPTSLQPGRWLDLYSGTGSVGIEAMSRGCSEVSIENLDKTFLLICC